jgi:hypothetical protein
MPTQEEHNAARNRARNGGSPPAWGSGVRGTYEDERRLIKDQQHRDTTSSGAGSEFDAFVVGLVLLGFAVGGIGAALLNLFDLIRNPAALNPPWSWAAWIYHWLIVLPLGFAGQWADSRAGFLALTAAVLLAELAALVGIAWLVHRWIRWPVWLLAILLLVLPIAGAGAWWSIDAASAWVSDAQDRRALSAPDGPLEFYGMRMGQTTVEEAERILAGRGETIIKRSDYSLTTLDTSGMPQSDGLQVHSLRYSFQPGGPLIAIATKFTATDDPTQAFERRSAEWASRSRTKVDKDTYRRFYAPGALIDLSLEGTTVHEGIHAAAPRQDDP